MSSLKELLKDVPVEWKPLEIVFEIGAGGDVPKDSFSSTKTDKFQYPILSNGIDDKSIYGWTSKAKIDKPSLTISARGTIGWTSIQYTPFFPIIRLLVITPKIDLDLKYAYYYMKTIEDNYNVSKFGIPQLTKPMIRDIPIPIPHPNDPEKSLAIQQEIVRVLDSLSEQNKTLTAALTNEIDNRKKQYEYYREELFRFEGKEVECKALKDILNRSKGTKITAEQMKVLHKEGAPLKIFAGGKTVAFFNYEDIPEKDINYDPSIIVKSRGVIEFEYYNMPFSHKNEMWSYYSNTNEIDIKYVYYFLKINESYFQNIGNRMQMPQISTPVTDKFQIPIPYPNDKEKSIKEQEHIVYLLDKYDEATKNIVAQLENEIDLRNKQYEYYRNTLLNFQRK